MLLGLKHHVSAFSYYLLNLKACEKKSSKINFAVIDKFQGLLTADISMAKGRKFLTELVFVIEAPGSDDPVKL